MKTLIPTAERINSTVSINNYVYQRHVIAYKSVPGEALWQKDVLELGCGEGYGMGMLAAYTRTYTAIDKKRPPESAHPTNARFVQIDLPYLEDIPDASFDTIICFQVIEHIKKDLLLLQQARRILKPGGQLFLTTPNSNMSLTRNPFHIREYTTDTMYTLIKKAFSSFRIDGISGNDTVNKYYSANKAQVEKITQYDLFSFQYVLPAWMLKIPYNLFNTLSRLQIARKESDLSASIHYTDFYVHAATDQCLDFFVVARNIA